jgi:hypothetical protein
VFAAPDNRGCASARARRGLANTSDDGRRVRFVAPGRELIDTMDRA